MKTSNIIGSACLSVLLAAGMVWSAQAAPVTAPADLEAGLAALDRGDHPAALRLLGSVAMGADPRAAAALADIHERGRGVPRDHVEGLRWRRIAAERGDPESAYRIGQRYASGDGVDRDDATAKRWFRVAAERGHGPAQLALTRLLGAAGASDADAREADLWHTRAAAAGAVAPPPVAPVTNAAPAGPTLSDLREVRRLRLQASAGTRLHAPAAALSPAVVVRDPVSGMLLLMPGAAMLPGIVPVPGLGPVIASPDGTVRRGW